MNRNRSAQKDGADEFAGFLVRPDRPIAPAAVIISAVLLISIAVAALLAAHILFGAWLWPLAALVLEALARWPAIATMPIVFAVLWKARR